MARRAVALRLAAMAGAPGVVDAAVVALAEDLLAEPAQQALAALGAAALPAMFARLADAAIPPEARAALVDVIADVLDGDSVDSSASGAVRGGLPARSAWLCAIPSSASRCALCARCRALETRAISRSPQS